MSCGLPDQKVKAAEDFRRDRVHLLEVDRAVQPLIGSRPMKMFSATERCGIKLNSLVNNGYAVLQRHP